MSVQKKVSLIHGPNFNILELRDQNNYRGLSLAEIESQVREQLKKVGIGLDTYQSNSEGNIVECIHKAILEKISAIIINAAAYSHTSIAILDALSCFHGPIIEVHLSNIFRREPYRHHSYVSSVATGVICGLGLNGYLAATQTIIEILKEQS